MVGIHAARLSYYNPHFRPQTLKTTEPRSSWPNPTREHWKAPEPTAPQIARRFLVRFARNHSQYRGTYGPSGYNDCLFFRFSSGEKPTILCLARGGFQNCSLRESQSTKLHSGNYATKGGAEPPPPPHEQRQQRHHHPSARRQPSLSPMMVPNVDALAIWHSTRRDSTPTTTDRTSYANTT